MEVLDLHKHGKSSVTQIRTIRCLCTCNSHLSGLPAGVLDVQKSQQILPPKSGSFEKQCGRENPYGLRPQQKNASNCHMQRSEQIKLSTNLPNTGTASPLPLPEGHISS